MIIITLLNNSQGAETCQKRGCVQKQLFEAISVSRQMDQLEVGEFLKPHNICSSDTYSSTKEQLQHELNEHLLAEVKRRGFESLESLLQWAKQSRFVVWVAVPISITVTCIYSVIITLLEATCLTTDIFFC